MKTSLSHPLQIPAVAPPGGGKIGMALCPGKRQPHAATGPWHRDLSVDMAAIRLFGTSLLVTLMEASELDQANVPADVMRAAAEQLGIAWMHLPIVDFQAPSRTFEDVWPRHSAAIRELLANGQNIVLHCRGGRGRSGMMAARLLVDFGFPPEKAIAAVRAVNPLAMETEVQESYIRSLAK